MLIHQFVFWEFNPQILALAGNYTSTRLLTALFVRANKLWYNMQWKTIELLRKKEGATTQKVKFCKGTLLNEKGRSNRVCVLFLPLV